MKEQRLRDDLLQIRGRYAAIADGGYTLVDAINAYGRSLEVHDVPAFAGALESLVADVNSGMRGVALDALAFLGPAISQGHLLRLLDTASVPGELKDQVAKELLQLRVMEAVPASIDRLNDGDERATKPALLASLASMDETAFRFLAVEFISKWYDSRAGEEPSWLPTFLYHISDSSESLLLHLIRDLARVSPQGRNWFVDQTQAEVAKPWKVEVLGSSRYERLQRQLRQVI